MADFYSAMASAKRRQRRVSPVVTRMGRNGRDESLDEAGKRRACGAKDRNRRCEGWRAARMVR